MSLAIGLVLMFIVAAFARAAAERTAPPIGRFIDAGGLHLHVLEQGPEDSAKPPVILIHGASANLRDMKIALGDRLAEDRRVVLIDRPGRGYSSRNGDSYKLGAQAHAIREAAAALGVERPIVVGQSFGGAVALAYALAYQEEMRGLVLLAPVSHRWPGDVAWYNRVSGWPVAGFFLRRLFVPGYGTLVAEKSVAKSFAPNDPPEDYASRSGLALLFRASDFRANAEDLRNLKAEVTAQEHRYGDLTLPVAIVAGDADRTVNPERHAKALARTIPGASLTLLRDTGHALHHAATRTIIDIIEGMPDR